MWHFSVTSIQQQCQHRAMDWFLWQKKITAAVHAAGGLRLSQFFKFQNCTVIYRGIRRFSVALRLVYANLVAIVTFATRFSRPAGSNTWTGEIAPDPLKRPNATLR
jgi:hypothetical protein